jgi:hypothetical protein
MRKTLLGLSTFLFAAGGPFAQSEIVGLPAIQSPFTELTVSWETNIGQLPNSDFLESRILKASFVYSVGIPSPGDDIYIRFEGGSTNAGVSPCLLIFVPGQSLLALPNGGIGIFDTDPKNTGIRNLLTTTNGEIIQDVTGDMTYFDLKLSERNKVWRMDIELEKIAEDLKDDWVMPGGSIGTWVVIGSSGGMAEPQKVEMVHAMR